MLQIEGLLEKDIRSGSVTYVAYRSFQNKVPHYREATARIVATAVLFPVG